MGTAVTTLEIKAVDTAEVTVTPFETEVETTIDVLVIVKIVALDNAAAEVKLLRADETTLGVAELSADDKTEETTLGVAELSADDKAADAETDGVADPTIVDVNVLDRVDVSVIVVVDSPPPKTFERTDVTVKGTADVTVATMLVTVEPRSEEQKS